MQGPCAGLRGGEPGGPAGRRAERPVEGGGGGALLRGGGGGASGALPETLDALFERIVESAPRQSMALVLSS